MSRDLDAEITELLQRKLGIDRFNREQHNMASYDGWILDAIELLLRKALSRHSDEMT